jgi:hypothetical protein
LGPKGNVLALWPSGETVICTVKVGTPVFIIAWSTTCDNVSPPPFFAPDEAAQRECAVTLDHQSVEAIRATVDDRETLDVHTQASSSARHR